jgi:hypothetical protein
MPLEILAPKKKNIVMDATVLSTLQACGRLTDFRFNHHFDSPNGKSNSLEVGSIVHAVLETYYKAIIQGLRRDQAIGYGMAAGELYVRGCQLCTDFVSVPVDTEVKCENCEGTGKVDMQGVADNMDVYQVNCDVCDSVGRVKTKAPSKPECGHKPDQYPGVRNTPPESTTSPNRVGWQDALDTCEEYFDYYKGDFWVPLKIEEVVGKVLYEDDEIRILWKAKLDGLFDTNDGIYPMDHKTMKQRRETLSLNNQFMGQCLVTGTNAMIVNKIGFQKTLKASDKFTRAIMSYTPERLIEWQTEILPFWAYTALQYAESQYWPPNFNHCDNKFGQCIFKPVCEQPVNMREEELRLNYIVGKPWNPTNDEE